MPSKEASVYQSIRVIRLLCVPWGECQMRVGGTYASVRLHGIRTLTRATFLLVCASRTHPYLWAQDGLPPHPSMSHCWGQVLAWRSWEVNLTQPRRESNECLLSLLPSMLGVANTCVLWHHYWSAIGTFNMYLYGVLFGKTDAGFGNADSSDQRPRCNHLT